MKIKETGIWSWGHVIYDYRGFFRNMKKLGMNKITIWNDFAPLNAKEIIAEAHKNGIAVVWGFAWGWEPDCKSVANGLNADKLLSIQNSVIKTYNEQYYDIAADGIYFQSFTELGVKEINGINIAQTVVQLVNSTSDELLKINPSLNIEFGLHATSVRENLDAIAGTDTRIKIIWEDLGAFPFAYNPDDVGGFEQTYELTKSVINLRGEREKCGFIIKGMTTLDWTKFVHATEPLIIGESDADFIRKRQLEKNPIWEQYTQGWQKNIKYAEKIFDLLLSSDHVVSIQALIEDGMFENEIKEPAILFSQLCNREKITP